jgi:hypothetical protein
MTAVTTSSSGSWRTAPTKVYSTPYTNTRFWEPALWMDLLFYDPFNREAKRASRPVYTTTTSHLLEACTTMYDKRKLNRAEPSAHRILYHCLVN